MIIIIVKVTLPNRILSFKGRLKYLVVSSILRFFLGGFDPSPKKDIPQKVGKQLSRWPKAWCHGGFSTRNSVIFRGNPSQGMHGEHRPYRSVPGKNWPPGFNSAYWSIAQHFLMKLQIKHVATCWCCKTQGNLFPGWLVRCPFILSWFVIHPQFVWLIDFSPPTLLTTKPVDFKMTPARTNMEPESDPFAKGQHLKRTSIFIFHVSFRKSMENKTAKNNAIFQKLPPKRPWVSGFRNFRKTCPEFLDTPKSWDQIFSFTEVARSSWGPLLQGDDMKKWPWGWLYRKCWSTTDLQGKI